MFSQPLPFIKEYLNQLEVALNQENPHNTLLTEVPFFL
jgi:hypothetical protein